MATPANIGSLAVGIAVGLGGAFVAELELPVAFMLTVTVTSLLFGLNLIFFGKEDKKPVKQGRGKAPKAPKAPEPKKKKKPQPVKAPAKKVTKEAKKSAVESESEPSAPAPAPAPAPARAPAPAPAPVPAPAPAPAPEAAAKAAKKKKNKKPKEGGETAPAPQASKGPAPSKAPEPAPAEEDGGGEWVHIPHTVQKKKAKKPEAAATEKGKAPAPVEKTDMKVAGKHLGIIIGEGGRNLKAIQTACDVTVSIPKDRKGGKDDIVTISIEGGTPESRQSARANVQSLIDNGFSKVTHGPEFTSTTFTVDAKKLGQVIGPKGETVKKIQEASGAKINTTQGSNSISILGTRDRVQRAKQIIDDLVNDGYSEALLKEGGVRQEVQFPRQLIGRLIGAKGQNTKRIQRETGTKIVIPDASADNQNIVVFGQPNDVMRAAEMILASLQVEKKPGEGEEEEDMAGWAQPVSADDAWDAADAAPGSDGWSSLQPTPGSAW